MCNIFIKFGGRESQSGGPEHLIENCLVLVRAPGVRYLQDALVSCPWIATPLRKYLSNSDGRSP